MKAIDLLRSALTMTDLGFAELAESLRSTPLVQPVTREGQPQGNHAMWIVGHLALLEASARQVFYGERNPLAHWAPLFAPGTQPLADAAAYPPYDEVLTALREHRAENLALLETIGDDGLDEVPKAPLPGLEAQMKTIGDTFMLMALHQMVHYGQLADIRRAVGLPSLR